MYIRSKRVKDKEYLYLVESKWDPKKRNSRQSIVKYLGNASGVTLQDVPEEYRNEHIVNFFGSKSGSRSHVTGDTRDAAYNSLTHGDLDGVMKIYEQVVKSLRRNAEFFELILRPVLHRIGQEWEDGQIDIATEHIASNTALSMIKMLMKDNSKKATRIKILLCIPPGEKHRMGCDVMELYLSGHGFTVYNLAGPAPTSDILSFVSRHKPHVVMISTSLDDNRSSARRLADKLSDRCGVPVILGGYAFREGYGDDRYGLPANYDLARLPRILRDMARPSTK